MAGKRKRTSTVHLTERSLRDIAGIEAYSIEQFGKKVAEQYIGKIEAALNRISDNPALLHEEATFHSSLSFYRVEKHLLACETGIEDNTIILTVIHASMDIPSRLAELEPLLQLEQELLLQQLRKKSV